MFHQKTVLSNGVRVITETIKEVRSVAIGFWLEFGSRNEPGHMSGAAHFLEHLLFKGTDHRSAREISEAFDRLGGEVNAFTSKEQTCYYSRLLDKHLEVGVEIIADMLQNSLFRPEDVDSERKVILEEISLHEDTPDDLIHDLFLQTLWPEHPLGYSIAGTKETVASLTRDDLFDLFGKVYHPNRLVVAAAGNLEHDKLVEMLNYYLFYDQPKEELPKESTSPTPVSTIRTLERPSEQAHIILGVKGIKAQDPRRFTLGVLDDIFGGGMSSRLFQEIREKHGLAYTVFSHHGLYSDAGYFSIYAGTNPQNAQEVVRRIKDEVNKLVADGITDEELFRAKEHLKGQMMLAMESTHNRMSRLGKSEITRGELLTPDQIIDRLDAINMTSVNDMIKLLFESQEYTTAIIGPLNSDQLTDIASAA